MECGVSFQKGQLRRVSTSTMDHLRGESGHSVQKTDDIDSNCHCFAYRHSKSCSNKMNTVLLPVQYCTFMHPISRLLTTLAHLLARP